jgi:sigma-B regulation protein RsbU (phosphoserine phosphatase)
LKNIYKLKLNITSLFCFLLILIISTNLPGAQQWKYSRDAKLYISNIADEYNKLESIDLSTGSLPRLIKENFNGHLWLIQEISPGGSGGKNIELNLSFYGSVKIFYGTEVIACKGFINDSSDISIPVINSGLNVTFPEDETSTKYLIIYYTDLKIDKDSYFIRYIAVLDYFKLSLTKNVSDNVVFTSVEGSNLPPIVIISLLAISLIYLIFHLFNHRKSFLFFAVYLFGSAVYITSITHPEMLFFLGMDLSLKLSLTSIFLIVLMTLLLYEFIRSEIFTKIVWAYIGISVIVILLNVFYAQFKYAPLITVLILSALSIQASRQIMILYKRKPSGYYYILASGLSFTGFWVLLLLNSFNIIFFDTTITSVVVMQQLLLLINAFTIAGYLAKVFTERSGYLEVQIEELKTQNERAIQKEKDFKKKEIAQRLLEAENSRKENEVEEARQIQLSLIPHTFPELKNVDIDAYMKTSKEVGGNYFDFYLNDDEKILTFILGDSNGRGIKSVIMTAATKSLFLTNGNWDDLNDLIKEFDTTLSKLGSGILTMALTIGRIRGNLLEIISAGMPAILIYRAKLLDVEQIIFRTSPIGSVTENVFEAKQFVFNKDDIILVMTEGFPKLENQQGEKLNYSRIMELVKGSAKNSVKEIADELTNSIRIWSDSKMPNDDVSFLIFKFK